MRAFQSFVIHWLLNQDGHKIYHAMGGVLDIYYEDVLITSLGSKHSNTKNRRRIDLEDRYKPSDECVRYNCRCWGKKKYLGDFYYFYPHIPESTWDAIKKKFNRLKKVFIK